MLTTKQKVNRLEQIKLEIVNLTKSLEEEKKRLELEIKTELEAQFNGETVYAKGDNISYYLYERTTTVLDKEALAKDVDLSKYEKKTTSIVLSNQKNSAIAVHDLEKIVKEQNAKKDTQNKE